jgi:hypothetical protein
MKKKGVSDIDSLGKRESSIFVIQYPDKHLKSPKSSQFKKNFRKQNAESISLSCLKKR